MTEDAGGGRLALTGGDAVLAAAAGLVDVDEVGLPIVEGPIGEATLRLSQNLAANAAKAVINSAIQGGSFEQNLKEGLKTALIDTAAATGASAIGDLTKDKTLDVFTNKVAHAIAGCAVGAVRSDSGGCAAGALGAAIGELAAETYGKRDDTVQLASMVGGLAVALAGGDATQISLGAQAGSNAAANNYMAHADASRMLSLANQCRTTCTPAQLEELANLFLKDNSTTKALQACTNNSSAQCASLKKDFDAVAASFLPNDGEIRAWSVKQSAASNGKYTTDQIYDAYRVSFIAGAQPDNSQGDLTEVADWMRDRITGRKGDPSNPGEEPLSKIAMGWAAGNHGSAQAAMNVQSMAATASLKAVNAIAKSAETVGVFFPPLVRGIVDSSDAANPPKPPSSNPEAGFKPLGLKVDDPFNSLSGTKIIIELEKTGLPPERAWAIAKSLHEAGSTLPTSKVLGPDAKLFKVVPKGSEPSQSTPFWISESEWTVLRRKPTALADALGLPPSLNVDRFDVFLIRPRKEGSLVFESRVAPTNFDGLPSAQGGAMQTLVIDRSLFTNPVKIETFIARQPQ
ncbi:hypothetical protein VARIO8X_130127 [Burkholderiales bacterium 8X]|nr:hypothetical protein VARIO8X_130127 [Burkholderiales bacterium 8X]